MYDINFAGEKSVLKNNYFAFFTSKLTTYVRMCPIYFICNDLLHVFNSFTGDH